MNLGTSTVTAARADRRRACAFTFTEIMVSTAIFTLVILGVVSSHMYGLKMMEYSQVRLGANDTGRKVLGLLNQDIRAARSVRVGRGSITGFTEAGAWARQEGSAIQLYPTNNTNVFIRYYYDAADQNLKRLANGEPAPRIVAESLLDENIFTSEDLAGNVVSNRQGAFLLGIHLGFFQLNRPAVAIGPSNFYRSFTLEMKVAARSPD